MHEHVKAHAAGETVTPPSLLKIAVPITLSNATVPLIGYVDTAVIGQLGQAHLIGAVGIGGVIFSVLYWTFSFLPAMGARSRDICCGRSASRCSSGWCSSSCRGRSRRQPSG